LMRWSGYRQISEASASRKFQGRSSATRLIG
jgi:hypothetical protein